MTEHYPSTCVEASAYCNKCGKNTMHRVVGKILQWCIPCYDRKVAGIEARKDEPKPREIEQGKLF
jgi:hypothetical protein